MFSRAEQLTKPTKDQANCLVCPLLESNYKSQYSVAATMQIHLDFYHETPS